MFAILFANREDAMSKVWFITGCSKGFGRELTEELLDATDALVVATARNPDVLSKLAEKYPDRLLVLKLDVTKQDQIEAAVRDAVRKFKRIDVLVNNAGYGLFGAVEEFSMDEVRMEFETNVFGTIAVTKEVLPIMRAQGQGHIFNMSSMAGLVAFPGGSMYCGTKHAIEGISESLAIEIAHLGIKVTIIEPSFFRTDFAGGSLNLKSALDPYAIGALGEVRGIFDEVHGKEPGDPRKAMKILIQLTEMKDPPLRLLLGNTSVDMVADKIKSLEESLRKNEKLSRSTDYDS
jgi:NAD(P)-dependent dehydrogenase (short-subunit alcohol dehydrogenase family)